MMYKTIAAGALLMATCLTLSISYVAIGDDDWWEDGHRFGERRGSVAMVNNKNYENECGSCHFAYQPGLLPARSWKKIMAGLEDHFGDNAMLDDATNRTLTDYLTANAADQEQRRFSQSIMRSIGHEATPLRFTKTRFFKSEHYELPKRMVEENPKVRSFSNCQSCHSGAARGDFDEHTVRIPGFGYWDD